MTQAELQQDIQRFTGVFIDRVAQAGEAIHEAMDPKYKHMLLQRVLLYSSSAIDIASGPYPEINTVDMMVFTALCRGSLEQHWIPKRFGEQGRPLVSAFETSEQDLRDIAAKILDARQQAEVRALIDDWQRAHPDQHRVEGVRFQQFSARAGEVSDARAAQARGLLGQVKSATQVGDQALLMSERAIFLLNRMPFLMRLQARLGVQETLADSLEQLGNVERLFAQVPELRPMLKDLSTLTESAAAAAHETRLLVNAGKPYLEFAAGAQDFRSHAPPGEAQAESGLNITLNSLNRLTDRSLSLVQELRGIVPSDPEKTLAAAEVRLDHLVRRWVVYLLIVGLGWAVFFWGCYFVAKRWLAQN